MTQAALRLGDRSAPGATHALGGLLERREQGIRHAAARALAKIETPEALGVLRARLTRETNEEVRSVIQGVVR